MKLMVTGAGGQLGRDLVTHCGSKGDDVVGLTRADLDVTAERDVLDAVAAHRPDTIVNCAAWTAVDLCEDDPARADAINGTAVGQLRSAAARADAHFVQISTDYVFDGNKVGPYVETDVPNPQSAYGRSKLLGEQNAGPGSTIIRTSWVCSAHGGNMVATVLRLAAEHEKLRFVDDQVGNPTFTQDLAVGIRELAVRRAAGMFHVTNSGAVSWFQFAQAVMSSAGLNPGRVLPITTSEMPRPAPRPANSVLAHGAYTDLGLAPLRHFSEPLAEVVGAYQ